MSKCGKKCLVFSRVCGYHSPVQMWNIGKKEEYRKRTDFDLNKAVEKCKDEN